MHMYSFLTLLYYGILLGIIVLVVYALILLIKALKIYIGKNQY